MAKRHSFDTIISMNSLHCENIFHTIIRQLRNIFMVEFVETKSFRM